VKHEQSPPASTMNHASGPDLVKLIECERVHAHLPALLAASFEGAPQESLVARLEPVARSLIRTLAADALPDQVAKRCTDWLVSELEQFDTKSLLELVELILGGLKATLRSGGGGATKPHCILPKCLGLLATVDKCCITLKDGSEVHNGAQVVEYAVRGLVKAPWHASTMTGLAETLREVALEKQALRDVVAKMLRKLEDVELTQLPALVYQLLLLSDAECKPLVLGELNAHFQRLLDGCAAAHAHAHSSQQDMDIVPTALDPEQLQHIQGTSILHIQFAVKQDQALGDAILTMLRTGQMPLGNFSLPLLLSMARIQRFEQPAIACVKAAIKSSLTRRSWGASSPWLAEIVQQVREPCVQQLLLDTVRSSASGGWDHLGPSFVSLCAALLDETKRALSAKSSMTVAEADGASSTGCERLPVEVQMVALGRQALLEAFRLQSMVRADVMETIFDRIVTGSDAVLHWVSFLQELVRTQPMMLLEHVQRLKTLLEYILHLPPSVAAPMLRSLLPLTRQRPELRDHLVLLLRKAMFNREEGMRLTAVHGFLLLLQASADDGGGGGGGGEAGGSSDNLQFQLEILGFIRRSFAQQASIRSALYEGLVPAFRHQPQLREMILELLLSQLRQYEEDPDDNDGGEGAAAAPDRGTPPLRLDRCMHTVGETPTLTEPLPHLLRAIALCIRCAEDEVLSQSDDTVSQTGHRDVEPGREYALPGLDRLRERLQAIVAGFSTCSLGDFQLGGDKVEMTQKKEGGGGGGGAGMYNCATARLLKATLEALLEWCVLCELPSDVAEPMEMEVVATQASQASLVGTALEQTMQVFKLFMAVNELIKDKGPKTKKLTPLPDLDFTLGAEACERVLRAMAGSGGRGRAAHIIRHVLRAVHEQAGALGTAVELARSGGLGAACAEGLRAVSCAQVLIGQLQAAEVVEGKEALSGRRKEAEAEAREEKKKGGKDTAKGKGKEKADGAKGRGAPPKMGSRLQLVLEALEGVVGALVHDPSLELLASALAPPPAGEEGAAAAGLLATFEGRLDVCRDMLTERLLPLARRLAACDSHGEAEVAVRVAAKISAVLPGPSLGGVLEWAGGLCEEDEVASDKLARQLLGFYLHLDQRAHVYGLGRALSMAQRLHDLVGDNLSAEEGGEARMHEGEEECALLTEGNAASLSQAVLEAVDLDLGDAERAFSLLQRARLSASGVKPAFAPEGEDAADAAGGGGGGGGAAQLATLEAALCERHGQQISVLRCLAKSCVEGPPALHLMTSVLRLYRVVGSLFRFVATPAKPDISPQLVTMLGQLSGEQGLGPAVYQFISFANAQPWGEGVTEGKVKREAAMVPRMIQEMEKFELLVVKLNKKSGVDLMCHMKKATSRDFRIKVDEVVLRAKKKEREEEEGEEEEEEEEGGKKKRAKKSSSKEGKAKASKKSKRKKGSDDEDEDEE